MNVVKEPLKRKIRKINKLTMATFKRKMNTNKIQIKWGPNFCPYN